MVSMSGASKARKRQQRPRLKQQQLKQHYHPPGNANGLPQRLASVDKKVRDKAIELLARWLECRDSVNSAELRKIWKGLFYCFWHTDKAPVQRELAERLSEFVPRLRPLLGLSFFEVFLGTLRREWGGIDHLRLDKFYLLVRKFVRGMFKALEQQEWSREWVVKYMTVFKDRAMVTDDLLPAQGASMHLAAVFLDELRPFLPINAEILESLLEPFLQVLARSADKLLVTRVREAVFGMLLKEGTEGSKLGAVVPALSLDERLFQLAAASDTLQANRGLLYTLQREFADLKKAAASTEAEKTKTETLSDTKDEATEVSCEKSSGTETESSDRKHKKRKKRSEKSTELEMAKPSKPEEGVLELDDTLVSNLVSKFDVVAADKSDDRFPPLQMAVSPLIVGNKRKGKKRQKTLEMQLQVEDDSPAVASPSTEEEDSPIGRKLKKLKKLGPVSPLHTASKKKKSTSQSPDDASTSSRKVKKVRFELKRNTLWKPTSPSTPAPAKLTSPSLTPRGSALKQGVPPGPVLKQGVPPGPVLKQGVPRGPVRRSYRKPSVK